MPFSSLWQALMRFWYVTLVGALLTIGLGVAAGIAVPAQHEAEARILLIQKTLTGTASGLNPYTGISGLTPFADIVARSMTDTIAVEALQDQGVTSEFTVARDVTTNGPVLLVTATNADAARAVADLDRIADSAAPVLSTLQSQVDVSAEALVSAQIITQDTDAATVRKGQIRAIVVAVALGGFLTLLTVALLGRWRSEDRAPRRAGRRARTERADGGMAGDAGRTGRAVAKSGGPRLTAGAHWPKSAAPQADITSDDAPGPVAGRRRRELAGRGAARPRG